MDSKLRAILERRGLPTHADEQAAHRFYHYLPDWEKTKIGMEMGTEHPAGTIRPGELLTIRATVEETDLTTRAFCVRADSVDEEARSVEAVIATDQPVAVFDQRTGELIDEVLRMDGVQVSDRVPMLANHSRFSLDDMYGSAREITTRAHELRGRLFFADGDEAVQRAWLKVRDGHIRDVSAGYRADKFTDIPPGKTANVGGQSYRARGRTLRVTTRWTLREVSLVPIGADSRSKIRADLPNEGKTMNEELRKYLESIGLRADADDAAAEAFRAGLEGDQLKRAVEIEAEDAQRSTPPVTPEPPAGPPADNQRTTPPVDAVAVARQAVTDERARVRGLTELAAGDVSPEVLQRAIDDGTAASDAAPAFLADVRARGPSGPAIHSHSHEGACTARSIAAGLLIGQGLDPMEHRLHNGHQNPGRRDRFTEQDADAGDQFSRMSAIDICRECVRIDGGRVSHDASETIRAAVSGTSLSSVFTTNVNARLLDAFELVGDTTTGWVDEEDVNNFQTQEDISLEIQSNLDLLPSGGTANHATMSDTSETYKIARYAKQFVVDEQTIIDDRLGAVMRVPSDMGEKARKLRPDLVYALMLENPTMTDTGAVFNATAVTTAGGHANLTTAALAAEGLRAAITAMVIQRLGRTADGEPGDALNIRPNFLIVPPDLEWTARALLSSGNLVKLFADTADPLFAPINLIAQEGITLVIDARIDAVGVRDPKTKTVRTGTATNWFLAAGGSRGLRVAYRTGTNRQPLLRSFALSQGQWGIGWDINMDVGVAFTEYRTWHKSTGAG